jgi:hypothetical protein
MNVTRWLCASGNHLPPFTGKIVHRCYCQWVTRCSVQVQFVKLGGREIACEVSEFAVKLPGNTVDSPLLLEIIADGYETWSVVLRQRVVCSRTVYFEVELSPRSPRANDGAFQE